ncbi:MAG: IS5 family transposase [Bacteroidota bacterium]
MQTQYERLTDSQWENIKEYLPVQRKRKYDLREIVDAIFWILRIGSQWRNLPECFPPWKSVYYYFSKWKKNGTLQRMNEGLNRKERVRQGKEPTPSMLNIDSQSIKGGPFISEDKGIDGNKRVNGRKRHIVTDTLGLVWFVVVHAANLTDGSMAHKVVEPLIGYLHRVQKILADAAYEKGFRDWVYANMLGVELELSSRPPSSKGFVPIKWRWIVEQTFGRFNFYRRLDKDHEKTIQSSEAWVLWQNCQTILYRLET